MKWLVSLIMIFLFVILYCLFKDDNINEFIQYNDKSYMENVKIIHKRENITKWTAHIKNIFFQKNDNDAKIEDILLNFPEKNIVLSAEKGNIDFNKNIINLKDKVTSFHEKFKIITDNIYWDISQDNLTSESEVLITSKRFRIRADEINTFNDVEISLLGNVRAVFR